MRNVLIGQTDYSVLVKILGTDGAPETGLAHTDIDIAYSRVETDNDVTTSDVSPASLSALTDAHSDWGWKEVSATDHPGLYRLDIADAVFASGAWEAVVTITDASGSDFYATDIGFRLVNIDPQASNLPANVTQFGGNPGTFSSGRPEVNATHWGGTAVASANVLIDGAITAAKIASDAITTAKIADGALTAAKFASGAFDAVWTVSSRTLTAATNITAGIAAAVWEVATSGLTTVGSIGKLLADNINATISSRSSHTAANVRTEMDSNSTQLAKLGTPSDLGSGASLAANLVDIESQTDDIGAAGAGLTALATAAELAKVPKSDGTTAFNATAVAGIQSGLATATELAKVPKSDSNVTWNATALASVNAEMVDALNTDTYAEPGQGAPGATISLAQKIGYLYKFLRNRITQTTTEFAVYADDGTTKDQKATVSDNGTTYERGEMETGA